MEPRSIERGKQRDRCTLRTFGRGLQWSRDQLNAERGSTEKQKNALGNASMEPRSIERGKPLMGSSLSRTQLLQWSRDQLNAES